MQRGVNKPLIRIFCLLILVTVITGCTKSSTSISTGEVTETTEIQSVESSGTVNATQLETLTWSTSGTVQDVYIQNNDTVTDGEELIVLESTSVPTDILEAVSELVTAKANLADVQESGSYLAQAEVALVEAEQTYQDALADYYTIDQPVAEEDYLVQLKNTYLKAQQATLKAEKAYNAWGMDYADDYYPKFAAYAALCQARINEADALTRLTHFSNPPTQVLAEQIKANLDLTKSQLDEAQKAYDKILAGNTDAIDTAQAAVDAAQATVNQMSIIAPFDGDIAVVYSQAGDVVSKGTKAAVIVDRSSMYIDIQVDEDSIMEVNAGDSAAITLDGLGITTTGSVLYVDPIGVVSSNVVNYTVRVQIEDPDPNILIGATATVVVTTGDPEQVMYVPVTAVLTDDEGDYVTRIKSDGTTERVSVTIGDVSDEQVKVTGDLQKGDSVELYASTASEDDSSDQNSNGMLGGFGGLGGIFR